MHKCLLLSFITIFLLTKTFSQDSNKYTVEIDKYSWKKETRIEEDAEDKSLDDGNLYIHFQSDFDKDKAEIKINGKFYGNYELTTEWTMELAKLVVIPDIESIKTISISINYGKAAVFEPEKTNQTIVRLRNNKLQISFSKYTILYD